MPAGSPAPVQVASSGMGAGLVLDFLAYASTNRLLPLRNVTVCYCAESETMLRLVRNALRKSEVRRVRIKTALLPHGHGTAQVKLPRAAFVSLDAILSR